MTGHSFRKYRFTKHTHNNQELGPFISHEMNRCIACYRWVRYYKDYADGTDFGVYGAHDNVYFGCTESGTLESEFSGNLVKVCPTGVFTDKTEFERYNRNGICSLRRASASSEALAITPAQVNVMANCATSKTAITAAETTISCAIAAASVTAMSTARIVRVNRSSCVVTTRST